MPQNSFLHRLFVWGSRQNAKAAGLVMHTVKVGSVECSYYEGIYRGRSPAPTAAGNAANGASSSQQHLNSVPDGASSSSPAQATTSTAAAAATSAGNAKTETILFIHGIGADKENWVPVLGNLARRGGIRQWLQSPKPGESGPRTLRILVPDLPGHGKSTRDKSNLFGIAANVEFLMDFMKAVNAFSENFHVVGHSMGGHIAGVIAADYAHKVKSLILAAPAGFDTPVPSEYAQFLFSVVQKLVDDGKVKLTVSKHHSSNVNTSESAAVKENESDKANGEDSSAIEMDAIQLQVKPEKELVATLAPSSASSSSEPVTSTLESKSQDSNTTSAEAAAAGATVSANDDKNIKLDLSLATVAKLDLEGVKIDNWLIPTNVEECRRFVHCIFYRKLPLPRFILRFAMEHILVPPDYLEPYFMSMIKQGALLQGRMHNIRAPTLVIWGDKDAILHVSGAEILKKTIGADRCSVVLLRNCGHAMQLEQPGPFKRIQSEFLAKQLSND